MNDPMKSEAQAVKRELNRDSLLLKAILRFPRTKDEGEVRIRNLSAGGLMAEAPLRVTRGELVEINLRCIGWISGHVAWVTEGRLGIAFDHPINPKDARKPVGTTEHEMPRYLKKIDNPPAPSRFRRL